MVTRFRKRADGRAFTLIEVLVVVAIIALLVAILLPSLARARAQARYATCLSNQKQFGLGMQQHAHVNSGKLPVGGDPSTNDHWTMLVARQMGLFKHIKSTTSVNQLRVDQLEIYHCPERTAQGSSPWIGYIVNAFNPDHALNWPELRAGQVKIDTYPRPSDVIYLTCAETESKLEPPPPNLQTSGYNNPLKSRMVWESARNLGYLANETIFAAQGYNYIRTRNGAIDTMDAWMGAQLPQGKTLNTDENGDMPNQKYRRVARKLHLNRFTNAVFFDGHAQGVPFQRRGSNLQNYLAWLKMMGLSKQALAEAASGPETMP